MYLCRICTGIVLICVGFVWMCVGFVSALCRICVGFVSFCVGFVSTCVGFESDSIAHAIERFVAGRVSKSPSTPKASSWDALILQSPARWPIGGEVRESLAATLQATQTHQKVMYLLEIVQSVCTLWPESLLSKSPNQLHSPSTRSRGPGRDREPEQPQGQRWRRRKVMHLLKLPQIVWHPLT